MISIFTLIFVLTGCGSTETSQSDAAPESQAEIDTTEGASDTLVVYFSATGNTKAIAENIVNDLSADIYEIVPEVPYTTADLDYGDDNSRSTVEMNDPSARPAIAGSVEKIVSN